MIPTGLMRIKMMHTSQEQGGIDALGQGSLDMATSTTVVGHIESQKAREEHWNSANAMHEDLAVVIPYIAGVVIGDTLTVYDSVAGVETSQVFNIASVEDDRAKHRWLRLTLARAGEVA